jgi:hypothetical protein
MIMNAFPRTQGTLSRESYLTLLLLALVDQTGGELRISSQSLEKLDSGGTLLVDWDIPTQQLVLRMGSPALVIAPVRGTGWTSTTPTASPSPQPSDPSKHRVMTEEQIIERMAQKIRDDNMRTWRREGAAAVAGMPPPDETAV